MPFSLHAQQKNSDQSPEKGIPLSAYSVKPLQAGEKIPEVSLATVENTSFSLIDYVKEQPVVLIFYRWGWWPYCNIHLRELQKADPELRKMGFKILAVSPDKPEINKRIVPAKMKAARKVFCRLRLFWPLYQS